MNTFLKYLAAGSLSALLLGGCSNEKNTWRHRGYHNLTSHYNGYFNARESFREGVFTIESGHEDNYTEVLPIYIYGDEAASKNVYPQMDRAIEKCEKVIQRHSIYINNKEYTNWIDDSYLLIGKCHFYKKDYAKARESFDYVAKAYKSQLSGQQALLWLARTRMENGQLDETEKVLRICQQNEKFPKKLKGELATLYADYYIRLHNHTLALPELKTAIAHTRSKQFRTRLTFILAQLYHKEENYKEAVHYYGLVAKARPPYEMEFYAKINRALAYGVGATGSADIKKQLNKMLHDEKNKEFRDQIYYALAELVFKEGEGNKGIEYLKESIKASVSNNHQKGRSFLKLADIHFDIPQYELAQSYYDSAVTFLDQNSPGYDDIVAKRNSLGKLVKDITTVQKQDSLQRLAKMDSMKVVLLIEDIIQKLIEEEERKKQEALETANSLFANLDNKRQDQGSGANWYFYNPSTLSFGFSEFRRLWGDRKLEDDWRRKNKSSFAEITEEGKEEETAPEDTIPGANDPKKKEYYLKDIPFSEEKMTRSHNKIIEALYDLGIIYKEDIHDNLMAIETFKELLERYDTCRYSLSSHYQLYRLYLEEEMTQDAALERNYILQHHPSSEYAHIINNPDYFKQKEKAKHDILEYYAATYTVFKKNQFREAADRCAYADSTFPDNAWAAKFHLLQAIAIGKLTSRDSMITQLKIVVALHPKTPEAEEAARMVAILSKEENNGTNAGGNGKPGGYQFDPLLKHSFVMVVPNQGTDINTVKTRIADFNKEFFRMIELSVSSAFLDKDRQMVSVKDFENKDKAMDYLSAFSKNKEALKGLNDQGYLAFVITESNYALLYKEKNVEGYSTFFKESYQPLN